MHGAGLVGHNGRSWNGSWMGTEADDCREKKKTRIEGSTDWMGYMGSKGWREWRVAPKLNRLAHCVEGV